MCDRGLLTEGTFEQSASQDTFLDHRPQAAVTMIDFMYVPSEACSRVVNLQHLVCAARQHCQRPIWAIPNRDIRTRLRSPFVLKFAEAGKLRNADTGGARQQLRRLRAVL
jgi:hypothetical protein